MNLKKMLLIILFIFPLSYSALFDLELLENYLLPAIILFVVTMLAITWMLSDLLSAPNLKAWVKSELKELIAAALIMFIVYAALTGADTLTQTFTEEENYQEVALTALYNFRSAFVPALNDIVVANHYIGLLTGYSYSFPVPAYYVTFSVLHSPHTGAAPISGMISQANNALVNGTFIYTGVITLAKFIFYSINLFVPLALALRFIPFTRKLGTTLIALCLGAALIFPTAVIIASEFHGLIDVSIPGLKTSSMKFDPPSDIADYCSVSDAFERMSENLLDPTAFFELRNVIPVGLTLLKIGEVSYALAECSVCCSATPWSFISCYFAQSTFIYNLIITGMEVVISAEFVTANVGSTIMGVNVAQIYSDLIPFFEGINNLMVLSYVDILFIGILTVIGTKSVSTALGGQQYLPMIERFLR